MGSGHRELAMTLGYIHGAHGARQETPARRPNQVLNKRLGKQPQHPEIGTVASLASRETCGHASVFLQPTPRAESCSTDDPSRPTRTTSDEPANSHQHKRLLPPERRRCQSCPELLPRPTRPPDETWTEALAVMGVNSQHLIETFCSSRPRVPSVRPGSREREVEGERCTTKAFSSGRRRAAGPTLPAQM